MPRYRPGLTLSLLAFLGLLLGCAWLLFSILAFKTAANDLYAQKAAHARTLLNGFVALLPDSLPVYPEGMIPLDSQAARHAQKLAEEAVFSRITLLDRNGGVIFSSGQEGQGVFAPFQDSARSADGCVIRPDGGGIVCISGITRDGAGAGTAGLLLSLAPENARLNRSRQLLIVYFVLDFILLLGFGSYVLKRMVVNPLNRVLSATEKITGGQYSQRLPVSGSAELASLGAAFNDMASALYTTDRKVTEQLTALETANRELRQAREETLRSEKLASIGLLAAGMAHEIGTPLASIMGYAELLSADPGDSAQSREYLKRITDDCSRIDRIVRGLLDFSRPHEQSGGTADVRSVVAETLKLLTDQGAFKDVNVTTSCGDEPLWVRCDRHQLQQVMINLLLNGRDALAPGGSILVRGKRAGESVCLDVLDNGCGIPDEALKHLFDPFFTTKPPGKGTGLGLAISARIIEGNGGRISVTSRVGAGSCFRIQLPHVEEGIPV